MDYYGHYGSARGVFSLYFKAKRSSTNFRTVNGERKRGRYTSTKRRSDMRSVKRVRQKRPANRNSTSSPSVQHVPGEVGW